MAIAARGARLVLARRGRQRRRRPFAHRQQRHTPGQLGVDRPHRELGARPLGRRAARSGIGRGGRGGERRRPRRRTAQHPVGARAGLPPAARHRSAARPVRRDRGRVPEGAGADAEPEPRRRRAARRRGARARASSRTRRRRASTSRRSRAQLEHAIAILTGQAPATFSLPRVATSVADLQARMPVVPTGLPSELLERRPDIAAAERRVAARQREHRRRPCRVLSVAHAVRERRLRERIARAAAGGAGARLVARRDAGADALRRRPAQGAQRPGRRGLRRVGRRNTSRPC